MIARTIMLALTLVNLNIRPLTCDQSGVGLLQVHRDGVQWSAAYSTDWEDVQGQRTLRAGDRVRTNSTGDADILFEDGSRSIIGQSTGLAIRQFPTSNGSCSSVKIAQISGDTINMCAKRADQRPACTLETSAARVYANGADVLIRPMDRWRTDVHDLFDTEASYVIVETTGTYRTQTPLRFPQILIVIRDDSTGSD